MALLFFIAAFVYNARFYYGAFQAGLYYATRRAAVQAVS